jgi:hypothetical protein
MNDSKTQLDFVRTALRSGEWVSGRYFLEHFIPRYGARIYDLKKEGLKIESRRTKGKAYSEYRLANQPLPAAYPAKPESSEPAEAIPQQLF